MHQNFDVSPSDSEVSNEPSVEKKALSSARAGFRETGDEIYVLQSI